MAYERTEKREKIIFSIMLLVTAIVCHYMIVKFRPTLVAVGLGAIIFVFIMFRQVFKNSFWGFWFVLIFLPLYPFLRVMSLRFDLLSEKLLYLISRWPELIMLISLFGRKTLDARRFLARAPLLDGALLLYMALGVIYVVVANNTVIAIWGFRVSYLFYIGFFIVRFIPVRKSDLEHLLKGLFLLGAGIALFGCIQAQFLSEAFAIKLMQGREVFGVMFSPPNLGRGATLNFVRAVSVLGDTLSLGAYCCVLILMLEPFLYRRAQRKVRLARQACFWLLAACHFYTTTRAGWVGTVVGSLFIGWHKRKLKQTLAVLGAIAVLGGIFLLATGSFGFITETVNVTEASAQGHVQKLIDGTKHMLANPWGIGLGMTSRVAVKFGTMFYGGFVAESWYLQVGNEMGILGLGLFLWITFSFISLGMRTYRRITDDFLRRFTLGVVAAYIGMSVFGIFLHVWSCLFIPTLMHVLIGIVIFHVEAIDQDLRIEAGVPEGGEGGG